jgi:hypothetical protein
VSGAPASECRPADLVRARDVALGQLFVPVHLEEDMNLTFRDAAIAERPDFEETEEHLVVAVLRVVALRASGRAQEDELRPGRRLPSGS